MNAVLRTLVGLSSVCVLASCTITPPVSEPTTEAPVTTTQVTNDAFIEKCGVTFESTKEAAATLPDEVLDKDAVLVLTTDAGDIPITLHTEQAPCTTAILAKLATEGFYDNTQCHRMTNEGIYILQCGDPTGSGTGGPGFSFTDEFPVGKDNGSFYPKGSVAMANAGANTNGSQFFFNYKDSPLPPYYTVFGTVQEPGLEVLAKLTDPGTAQGEPDGPPKQPVIITNATVEPLKTASK